MQRFVHILNVQPLTHSCFANHKGKLNPTVIGATVSVFFASVIPFTLAWIRLPWEHGSPRDADFWLSLQNSLFQLLGVFLVIQPISRFAPKRAWQWACAIATAGVVFAVFAPLLFCLVPVAWSALCSFLAAAAQAAIVLELVLRVESKRVPKLLKEH